MTVREAWADLEDNPIDCPKLSSKYVDYLKQAKGGDPVGLFFSDCRLDFNRPSFVLRKGRQGGGIFHPSESRYCTSAEIKILGSFPDSFRFGTYKNAVQRIGNSVPPKLMEAIARHIRKEILKTPGKPTVISTFAGGGGSSLGYHQAGFEELLAVEWDDDAVRTLRDNFPDLQVYHGDIKDLSVEECLNLAGIKPGDLDVFDGSPPCQGFSDANRSRKLDDPRNSLFGEFVRLLEGLKPKVFVMENVKGMIKGAMKQIFLQIMASLRGAGYHVEAQVMNAKHYGVPQSRERVIFIGLRKDLIK
jgi:site-specific DNA-cytosine methylase